MNSIRIVFVLALLMAGPAHAQSLDEKLQAQWQRYDEARALSVSRVNDGKSPGVVSRAEWETLIAGSGPVALSEADVLALKNRQTRTIRAARLRAIRRSKIDLAKLRSGPKSEIARFCATLPKGGMLHIHPSGTVSRDTARNLLEHDNPAIDLSALAADLGKPSTGPYLYPSELSWLRAFGVQPIAFQSLAADDQVSFVNFFVLPPGSHPFPRFDAVFDFVDIAENGRTENVERIYRDFAARAAAENVSYVEFTTSARAQNVSFLEGIAHELEKDYGLIVRFNQSFFRGTPVAQQFADAQSALDDVHSDFVTGIDLLGDETHTPALEQGQVYYAMALARAPGRHRTQHAGELGDPRDPRDAMILGAERLGHGVQLRQDAVALEYAREKQIAVEVNLTSNLRLRAIDDIKRHPYLDYLRLGLPISLSTDDEGIFDTDIDQDCELAVSGTDVTYAELKDMAFNSITTAFAGDDVKARLRQRLTQDFTSFERTWRGH